MTERWLESTDTQRAKAARRAAAVRDGRAALASDGGGGGGEGARLHYVAVQHGVSVSTLRRWMAAAEGMAPDTAAMLDARRAGRPGRIWQAAGAEDAWSMWLTDYLREEKPTATECLRRVLRLARVRGWDAPSTEKAYLRRLKKEVSPAELVRARDGALPLLEVATPMQERSVEGLRPLDVVCGDGKRHDLMVVLPSGKAGRPVVWYWQDVRTRRILAWQAGETESAEMVRLSLHSLITTEGVPGRVLVDSTRAAANKWLTGWQGARRRWRSAGEEVPGILHTLGIGYSCTAVDRDAGGRGRGRGRAKPVERAFRDLAHYIDTHPLATGAYTGRSPMDRPETHRQRTIDWETFCKLVAEGVADHNSRAGRRTEAARGRSFDECYRDEIARTTIRWLAPAQAALLLLAVESCKVRRDGTLTLKAGRAAGLPGNRYYHRALTERAGDNLIVRFAPDALHDQVHVFDAAGRYVCAAECLQPVGFSDHAAAKTHERERRQFRRATEDAIAARTRMDELLDAHAAADPPTPAEPAKPAALRLVTGAPETPAPPKGKGRTAARPANAPAEGESSAAARRKQLMRGLRIAGAGGADE